MRHLPKVDPHLPNWFAPESTPTNFAIASTYRHSQGHGELSGPKHGTSTSLFGAFYPRFAESKGRPRETRQPRGQPRNAACVLLWLTTGAWHHISGVNRNALIVRRDGKRLRLRLKDTALLYAAFHPRMDVSMAHGCRNALASA